MGVGCAPPIVIHLTLLLFLPTLHLFQFPRSGNQSTTLRNLRTVPHCVASGKSLCYPGGLSFPIWETPYRMDSAWFLWESSQLLC